MNEYVSRVINELKEKDASMPTFIQAVEEVLNSVDVIFDKHPEYEKMAILERLVEPERTIMFKVPWTDDNGVNHVNRGFRVQYNSALGPYKGGLRLHPTVSLDVLKFLGFEQIFKNSLTTLPMGGGKGGSDFNPKGKSDAEVMRFCQSFMTELYRHIGPDVDVPAGDLGVGGREIGYLYGQYRRLKGCAERGVLTGKGLVYGGSLVRTQATGYGLVYFVLNVMKAHNITPEGKRALVSGSGNVAIYAAEKAMQNGMTVIGMSDSKGYILDDELDLAVVKQIKEVERGSLADYPARAGHGTYATGSIYDVDHKAEVILPCATQNEINLERAERLVKNGAIIVAEGANMPDNNDAIAYYLANGIIFCPGKASNAGGVATSGLEMSQNSMRYNWSAEEVDEKLQGIMAAIHEQCVNAQKMYDLDPKNYVAAANIAGMQKVIDAMIAQGDY
ncbi:MAG: NADP-specific glutamate dehydrogenase [Erysipelotrichaceae bacterium]|nr:NADP-specific glutamate dehydrogenase [Erysipelotrichaceae bacterium]